MRLPWNKKKEAKKVIPPAKSSYEQDQMKDHGGDVENTKSTTFLYEPEPEAPMYLMDVDVFSEEGKFLRQDIALNEGKLVRYRDLEEVDRAQTMIVFISHRWLNTDSSATNQILMTTLSLRLQNLVWIC